MIDFAKRNLCGQGGGPDPCTMLHRIITCRSGFGARDERQKAINLRSSGPAGEGRHADTLGALRQWGKEALIARRCKQACTGYGVGDFFVTGE